MRVERMTGIEPAYSAWEADVLPLNYIRSDLSVSLAAHAESSGSAAVYPERVFLSVPSDEASTSALSPAHTSGARKASSPGCEEPPYDGVRPAPGVAPGPGSRSRG